MTPITVSHKDLQKVLPPGKGAWENHVSGSRVQLYEATKPDFTIVLVVRIVAQAFLMPNFETPRIPYFMRKLKHKVFEHGHADTQRGENGSRLWVVNDVAMMMGRSTF
jgi:hypothetical protein